MTTALWIANVVVAVLVIADMLYGRYMVRKMMSGYNCECNEEVDMDYAEMDIKLDDFIIRLDAIEKEVYKPKRTSKPKSTKRKKK